MFKSLKFWLIASGVVGVLAVGWYVKALFDKANERDFFAEENKALRIDLKKASDSLNAQVKVFRDSTELYKWQLIKTVTEAKNKSEIDAIKVSLIPSIQSVVAVMRDSVIKINKDRAALEGKVLELTKDLERAKKKRKFL